MDNTVLKMTLSVCPECKGFPFHGWVNDRTNKPILTSWLKPRRFRLDCNVCRGKGFLVQSMTDEQILEKHGWTIECESPFEIRHSQGSFATLLAAEIVLSAYKEYERSIQKLRVESEGRNATA